MAVYNVHAGHNMIVRGACGVLDESTENRAVKELVIAKLRYLGNTVYDCTDEVGKTKSQNLANIVAKCNQHKVDLDISIHFNAFNKKAYGTEVYQYSTGTNVVATNIVNSIAELGYKNRGVKISTSLYVLRKTNCPAILIECCFCDNADDASKYTAEKMATAIVKGITGKVVNGTGETAKPSTPVKNESVNTNTSNETIKTTVTYKQYQVTASSLNVRKGPSTSYGIATVIKKNQVYTIVETKNGWGRLKSGAGWVSMSYMKYVKDVVETVEVDTFKNYTVKITASSLNVRKGPGTNYKINTTVRKNQVYTIVDEKNGWGELKSGAGWISLKYTAKC